MNDMISQENLLEYLYQLRHSHRSLTIFQQVLSRHGSPQDQFATVHIAGTNGKGSTVNYLRTLLQANHLKVGTFTSPHLESHYDRIRINDQWIPVDLFYQYYLEIAQEIEDVHLNMFEVDFYIACRYFQDQKVDIALIEVGVGGRLDATNTLHHPLCCAITSIGLDHQEYLGNTKEEIAKEKAGIIKHGVPIFLGNLEDGPKQVIQTIAKQQNAKVYPFQPQNLYIHPTHYQNHNIAVAYAIYNKLKEFYSLTLSQEEIQYCFQHANWKGRFEHFQIGDCQVVLDGGHNLHAMQAMIDQNEVFDVILFCGMKDKPVNQMTQMLKNIGEKLIVTQIPYPRCAPVMMYADEFEKIEDPNEALFACLQMGKRILIIGSLYFVSYIRPILKKEVNPNEFGNLR